MRWSVLTAGMVVFAFSGVVHAASENIPKSKFELVLKATNCDGNQHTSKVCAKNDTTSTITKLKCGSYGIPLSAPIPPGHTAAAVDLSEAPRHCRNDGVTASTDDGKQIVGKLNGSGVDDSTEVWFRDQPN